MEEMIEIQCQIRIVRAGDWNLARIPKQASKGLPTRGMVMITAKVNGMAFQTPLEPDGYGSHWFRIDDELMAAGLLKTEDVVHLQFSLAADWPEPDLPPELSEALKHDQRLQGIWNNLTRKAHWEWFRWIRSVKSKATRSKRVAATLDKLNNGHKRPCCFNSTACSVPELSKAGRLQVGPENQHDTDASIG